MPHSHWPASVQALEFAGACGTTSVLAEAGVGTAELAAVDCDRFEFPGFSVFASVCEQAIAKTLEKIRKASGSFTFIAINYKNNMKARPPGY